MAEPAVRRAGRIADGYMSGDISAEGFAEQVGWVRDELPRRELAGEPELSLYQATLAAVDGDAWERVRDHRHYLSWKYDDMDEATARTGPSTEPPPLTAEVERELRELTLTGTPEQVAEQIGGYRDAAGDGLHFVAQLYWPGMPYPRAAGGDARVRRAGGAEAARLARPRLASTCAAAAAPLRSAPSNQPACSAAMSDPAKAMRPAGRKRAGSTSSTRPAGAVSQVPREAGSAFQSWCAQSTSSASGKKAVSARSTCSRRRPAGGGRPASRSR